MKIALAIPFTEDIPGEAFPFHILQAVQISKVGELQLATPMNECPHDRMRNRVFRETLAAKCDLLMFIDDDTIVPKDAFALLWRTMQETKAQVVSGHYFRRGWPYTCVWSKNIDGGSYGVDATEGVHEIDMTGFGCCLIDLKWVEQHLTPPWCLMEHDEDGTIVSDDVWFMREVRKSGGKIIGDADVRCVHVGGRVLIDSQNVDQLRKDHMVFCQKHELEDRKIPPSKGLLMKGPNYGNDRK